MRRQGLPGYVYIAGSLEGRLIKIGETEDVGRRATRLRAESYGGFSDWRILVTAWVRNRGRTENEISSRIVGKRIYSGYFKDGYAQTATEIIQCSFSAALKAFITATLAVADWDALLAEYSEYEFGDGAA